MGTQTPQEPGEDEHLDLVSKVYKLIIEHGREGILQSTLWKKLNLTSRDGSRISLRLERRGMIKRERVLEGGRWTYKLTPLRFMVKTKSIERAPCLTCVNEQRCAPDGEVTPLTCMKLAEWVLGEGMDGKVEAKKVR